MSRLRAEAAEAERKAAEAAAARAAAEEQLSLMRLRCEQLRHSRRLSQKHEADMEVIKATLREAEEWDRLMRCDGLPDARNAPELTRYLSLWEGGGGGGGGDSGTPGFRLNSPTLDSSMADTPEIIQSLEGSEKITEPNLSDPPVGRIATNLLRTQIASFPSLVRTHPVQVINSVEAAMDEAEHPTPQQQRHWKEVWLQLQVALRRKLDRAIYDQLLDLAPHLDHDSMVYSFFQASPLVSVSLWSNTTRSPKNSSLTVEELGVSFDLPPSVVEKECVVRVMRTEYDHYSKFSASYSCPSAPTDLPSPTLTLLDIAESLVTAAEARLAREDLQCDLSGIE
ncbi:Cancer susceptibility candidate 1 N-terminal, partial [Trinorchestia longiramus]